MCRIHAAYAGPEEANHNCLGCNFNDLTDQVSKFLQLVGGNPGLLEYHEGFSLLSQLVNSVWERIADVFDMLTVPQSYRCRHYGTFIRLRRWANFFKHPKEFGWLVHHPEYCNERSTDAAKYRADKQFKIVDDEFLKKYYSADRCKGLAGEFAGFQKMVVVVLPDLMEVITQIAAELED